MDAISNPYAPGAGERPDELAGRDSEIDAWDITLKRAEQSRSRQSIALYGLRGVGKTVLLNELRRMAEARGWLVAPIEAGAGRPLRELLSNELQRRVAREVVKAQGRPVWLELLKTAFTFKVSVDPVGSMVYGLDVSGVEVVPAATGIIEYDLGVLADALARAVQDGKPGAVILIDEAQDLTASELQAICAIAHRLTQEELPVLFALAGLPSLPRLLSEAKSYSERLFRFRAIGALDADQGARALLEPARRQGADWDVDAITRTLELTQGYPYFLQLYGRETWDVASGSPIGLMDVESASTIARQELDGFYLSRWDRATPAEREYLTAMSVDGDSGSRSSEVAARLGRTIESVAPTRSRLILKGLVYAPEHGAVNFTVPGMAGYIATRPA